MTDERELDAVRFVIRKSRAPREATDAAVVHCEAVLDEASSR
jgi:hypothetical protein